MKEQIKAPEKIQLSNEDVTGCSQGMGAPKWEFVMGSRTQGVQEIEKKIYRMSSPPQV